MKYPRYELWQGKNKFYCNGKCIAGTDRGPFFCAIVGIVGAAGVYWGGVIPRYVQPLNWILLAVTIYGVIISLVSLIGCHMTDPGVLPRHEKAILPEKLLPPDPNDPLPPLRGPPIPARMVTVNGTTFYLKFCETCQIFRPPRAVHCSTCDNCVLRFDHHCPWVGNCVGLRNYHLFLSFVYVTTLNLTIVFISCIYMIVERTKTPGLKSDFGSRLSYSLEHSIPELALIVYSFLLILSVGGLACYHANLACNSMTTNEDIKKQYKNKRNPFFTGGCSSFWRVLFPFWIPSVDWTEETTHLRFPKQDWTKVPIQIIDLRDVEYGGTIQNYNTINKIETVDIKDENNNIWGNQNENNSVSESDNVDNERSRLLE